MLNLTKMKPQSKTKKTSLLPALLASTIIVALLPLVNPSKITAQQLSCRSQPNHENLVCDIVENDCGSQVPQRGIYPFCSCSCSNDTSTEENYCQARASLSGEMCHIFLDNCKDPTLHAVAGSFPLCSCSCLKTDPANTIIPGLGKFKLFCNDNSSVNSAIGCIPTEPSRFTRWILKWLIGISGGIAFLLIVYAAFQIISAAGNPQQVQAGQELLTSAITGLIFIIGSLFLLKLIGIEILAIPGLS